MSSWNKIEKKNHLKNFLYTMFFMEKPKIKHLSNIELLHELPFFDELSVAEI